MLFSEEIFLKKIREEKIPVTVFLIGGIKLQGLIVADDARALFLRRDSHTQMIYKTAVSTVMPSSPVSV